MKRCILASLIAIAAISYGVRSVPARARPEPPEGASQETPYGVTTSRFAPVNVYIDSGNRPLAAYQFELKAATGRIKIVGVEGGQHAAFKEPPYYDPAALANDHIIIGAFNTGSDLPTGRTRIATVHLQIIGDTEPQYKLILMASADSEGRDIPAELSLEAGETK
jgi:hypothetical protein